MLGILFLDIVNPSYERELVNNKNSDVFTACIYNCIARFSIPVYICTFGIYYLNTNKPLILKNFFKNRIFSMVVAFIFWATLNSYIKVLYSNDRFFSSEGLLEFSIGILKGGEYLIVYLILFGCFLCVPVLRSFANNEFSIKYFLFLWLFWGSFIPTVKNILFYTGIDDVIYIVDGFLDRFHFRFAVDFIGYFVAGSYFINNGNIKSHDNRVRLVYLCIIDVFLFTYLTINDELEGKYYSNVFRDYQTLFIAYYAFAVTAFFKNIIGNIKFSERFMKLVSKLSSLSLGAYLVHIVVQEMMKNFGYYPDHIGALHFTPILGIPLMFIISSTLSYLIAYIISNIPILKDYLI